MKLKISNSDDRQPCWKSGDQSSIFIGLNKPEMHSIQSNKADAIFENLRLSNVCPDCLFFVGVSFIKY